MNRRHFLRNELFTLLTQGKTHEELFEEEVQGCSMKPPLPEEALRHLERWHLPELGFRNYWYPVMRSLDVKRKPVKRRLLGEDIVFWRDGGKVHAIADRCPHRGASLSQGHVRFPGSGTISCPYHGWTFDGTGALRACIQEGPCSVMPAKVKTRAYPVEERLNVVWVWIGDLEAVPLEEDIPVAFQIPNSYSLIHFTKVWSTNWALLFDNFMDGLHAPYLHRMAPQFLLRRLPYRTLDGQPHFQFTEHGDKFLEAAHVRKKDTNALVYELEFPNLGKFPRNQWWRIRSPKVKAKESFVPGVAPGSFIHGLPCYIHTGHRDMYFTQFLIPIDRFHLYSMCALTGRFTPVQKLLWKVYYPIFCLNHDRIFIGQDHRILRYSVFGPERLSPLDQDIIYWRKFAVDNARGYDNARKFPSKAGRGEEQEYGSLREAR
jgi:nitrite reductase/ring-hydroxylating ferredoxin subunit